MENIIDKIAEKNIYNLQEKILQRFKNNKLQFSNKIQLAEIKILQAIYNLLNDDDIFEYYEDKEIIYRVCYRIKYNNNIDVIIVLDNLKTIVTLYINSEEDNHITLKKKLYINE